jgi:CPA2 family monovalent cation:H+ antiporter-2
MKESALLPVLIEVSMFLAAAALFIPLLKKINIPSILGYLLVGLVLGPYGLAQFAEYWPLLSHITLENTEQVKLMAELGIIMLLFMIGLELSLKRLWQMRSLVFGLGTAQVVVTALVIGLIATAFGNSPMVSTLLGSALALSSTAIVVHWLHEQHIFATAAGRTSFGILLLQDLAVIPILFLLTIFAAEPGQTVSQSIVSALGEMAVTVVIIYLVGRRIVRPIFVFANRYGGNEVFMALTLLVIVVTAIVAGLSGLSMALGAFLAGILLGETEYRHEITNIMAPFKSILLGVFFLSFGMTIDVSYILTNPFWLFLSALGLILIKGVIIYVLSRLWGGTQAAALESAILMPQAGEFGLLVIGSAVTLQLMAPEIGQFMLIVVGLTMLATPLLAIFARRAGGWLESRHAQDQLGIETQETEEFHDHTVVIGYGRMGRFIAENLAGEGVTVLAFDNDAARVSKAQKAGVPVYFGDATKKATLTNLDLEKAKSVVITIDNAKTTNQIVKQLRQNYPDLSLFVRAAKISQAQSLEAQGVTAVPEYIAVSNELMDSVLEYYGLKS